jgi:hypothetical protein
LIFSIKGAFEEMKHFIAVFGAAVLASGLAFAQSSGNFSATGSSAACVINGSTGALSGGVPGASFTADISTGSGNGTTLLIRPSLVTGLFTDTKISTSIPTATADVGIRVCVSVDGSVAGTPGFFVNGVFLSGAQPLAEFEKIIDSQLALLGAQNSSR